MTNTPPHNLTACRRKKCQRCGKSLRDPRKMTNRERKSLRESFKEEEREIQLQAIPLTEEEARKQGLGFYRAVDL